MFGVAETKGMPQDIDMFGEQARRSIGERNREEKRATRDEVASVIGHQENRIMSVVDGLRFASPILPGAVLKAKC